MREFCLTLSPSKLVKCTLVLHCSFKMPPMLFTGIVTKVGCMNKTATVTVYRNVIHKITGKVSAPPVNLRI